MPESAETRPDASPDGSNPWMAAAAARHEWRGPRPSVAAGWIAILVAVVGLFGLAQLERSNPPAADPLAGDALFEMQAKVLYAADALGGDSGLVQARTFMTLAQPLGMAWRVAALLAGMEPHDSPDREGILSFVQTYDDQAAALGGDAELLHEAVKTALRDPDQLDPRQRQMVIDHLGWFGDLLLAHSAGSQHPHRIAAEHEAFRVMWIGVGVFFGAVLLLLAGSVLFFWKLVTHVIRYGELRIVMHQMHAPPAIYLEAVAAYLLLAFILPVGVGLIPGAADSIALSMALLAFASIAGVAWPFVRHRSAREVASDLGLTRGRGVWREIGAGIIGYVAASPVFFVGVLVTIGVMTLYVSLARQFGWDLDAEGPVAPHPVVQWIAHGPLYARLGVLLLAAGFAPLFEEIMFRGALLGGAARTIGLAAGILVMAFIFAAIHPQGWLAIPALMSLAIAFALIRIWRRGSLIACMTAHAVHNGFLVLLMIVLFG